MDIGLHNFALHLWHGYSQVAPAHHAHTFWSLDRLRAHNAWAEQRRARAHAEGQHLLACSLHVHGQALTAALGVRAAAARFLTDPVDLVLGTGCFASQARSVYEAPGEALANVLHRPLDSGAVGLAAVGFLAIKVAWFAAAGCLLGATIGALRPRGQLERDAAFGLKVGANVGAAAAALVGVHFLLALNGARLSTATLKGAITSVAYALVLPGVLFATACLALPPPPRPAAAQV